MARTAVFLYSIAAYAVFLLVFLYFVAFVGNLFVPKSIDVGATREVGYAIAVDLLLLSLFGLQHSVMARPAFKDRIIRHIPAAMERSTFVLVSSLVLAFVMQQWQPLSGVVWQAQGALAAVLWTLFALGWGVVLLSTFLINHFDLFGLRQGYLALRERPLTPVPFRMAFLYRVVRHPLMLGFLIAFWFTPHMTIGHLLFAAGMTIYIVIGIRHEERDLVEALGPDYAAYRRRTPAFVPGLPGASAAK